MLKQRKGKRTAAIKQYETLAKMYPQDVDAQFMLGAMYFNMQDAEKSLTQLTRVTELDKNYAPAYNLLGYSALYQGDNTAAETAFRRYIELRPDRANPHDSYAEFLMKQGRFTEAVQSYRTAFSLDSRYVSAKARADVALALAGNEDLARAHLQRAAMANERTRSFALYRNRVLQAMGGN
jgi:Tfp pilus assembly protein PilF